MLQYILTGIAGIALGIVGMRIWQSRDMTTPDPGTAAAAEPGTDGVGLSRTRLLLIASGVLVVIAIAALALRSPESGPGSIVPSASTAAGSSGQSLSDVDTMISQLAARLEKDPNDGDGFRMLGWSYVMTGRPEQAVQPYRNALKLLPARADVHAGLGEALVGTAKGKVTEEARALFDKAVALDPKEPRARYFLALWQAQHGEEKQALEKWIALANGGPAEAPWQADLRRQIAETSKRLGVDVSARLTSPAPASLATEPPPIDPAAAQAASQLPAGDRQAMVDSMVEGLAAKLKSNPGDTDGWIKLLRSRMVLQQGEKARSELATARTALAADKAGLARLNAAAAELGVPGAQ